MHHPIVTVLLDRAGTAGGAERYWQIVIPALREAGIDVRVLARDAGAKRRFGVPVTEVAWGSDAEAPSPPAAAYVREILRSSGGGTVVTASVFDRAVLDVVRAEAKRWIVRIHDHRTFCPNGDRVFPQFAGICTRPAGAACARNALLHGCMHGPHPASGRRLAGRLEVGRRVAAADAVLVSSTYMRASALANGLDPGRVFITPPPLGDTAYARVPRPRPQRDTVLFAGRLTPQKGLPSLVRSLARIAPERRPLLVVAGSGTDEARSRRQAARLGVEVAWRGWLSPRELRSAIDDATIVVVPSLEPEPFGVVGIEAQARGRPAVAYAVGGIPEWIGGAGIAVPRGDERALAGAIAESLKAERWQQLARAARRASDGFRLRPHLERLIALLDGPGADGLADGLRAAEATMPVGRARPIRHSPVHPNRPTADRRSSGS